MSLGCISFNRIVEMLFIVCNLNVKQYVNIQQGNLFNSALKLKIGDRCYLQYDNNPKHTANIKMLWFL